MLFSTQQRAGAVSRLRAFVRGNPFAQKAIISAAVHLVVIIGLCVGFMVSCRTRTPREISPFDLQMTGPAGRVSGGGGAPAAALRASEAYSAVVTAPKAEPEDAIELSKPKPSRQKIEVSRTPAKRLAPAGEKKMTQEEIRKQLISAVANVGSTPVLGAGIGSSPSGIGSGPSGGGTYDPFAWYLSQVRAVMYEAWQQPSSLVGKRGLLTRVVIRVQRDGQITQRTLRQPSGNALMDTSVMTAVESVQRLQELPVGFGGAYRDITIDFELSETGTGE